MLDYAVRVLSLLSSLFLGFDRVLTLLFCLVCVPCFVCLHVIFCLVLCSTQLVFYTRYVLSCCLILWYLFYWSGLSLCHVLSCQFVLPRPSCYLIIGSFAPLVLLRYLLCLLSLFIRPVFALLCWFVHRVFP